MEQLHLTREYTDTTRRIVGRAIICIVVTALIVTAVQGARPHEVTPFHSEQFVPHVLEDGHLVLVDLASGHAYYVTLKDNTPPTRAVRVR